MKKIVNRKQKIIRGLKKDFGKTQKKKGFSTKKNKYDEKDYRNINKSVKMCFIVKCWNSNDKQKLSLSECWVKADIASEKYTRQPHVVKIQSGE